MRPAACVVCLCIFAGAAIHGSPSQQAATSEARRSGPAPEAVLNQNSGKDGKKEKDKDQKKKKDKKKTADAGADVDAAVFSEAVANRIMGQLRDALEGHNQRLMLSLFDRNKMEDYLSFEDQIQSFFDRYETFRVHLRILQVATEESKGIVLIDIEMEQIPQATTSAPVRKHDQIRLELESGGNGWKIVSIRPRDFFS